MIEETVLELAEPTEAFVENVTTIQDWESRSDVGVFEGDVATIEQLVMETTEKGGERVSVEYAFPKRGADGAFTIVEARLSSEP